jgi:hypothetical protein
LLGAEIAPALINATHFTVPGVLALTFDMPMILSIVAGANIKFRYNNWVHTLAFWQWSPDGVVRYYVSGGVADPGPDICSYVGSDMHFYSSSGVPAQRWSDFPVGHMP